MLNKINKYTVYKLSLLLLAFCFSDINECSEYFGICQNGGQCFNSIGGYTCQCATGWTGQNCTEGMQLLHLDILVYIMLIEAGS